MKNTLKIGKQKEINLSKIIPYENNIPIHNSEDVERLKTWIQGVGYRSRIGVDADNVIVYGHKRFMALKLINPNMKIPVDDLSDLTPAQIKKLRIYDNTSRTTEIDEDKLRAELESMYKDLEDRAGLILEELKVDVDDLVKEINDAVRGENDARHSSDKIAKVILEYDGEDYKKYKIYSRDILDREMINSVSDLVLFLMESYLKNKGIIK